MKEESFTLEKEIRSFCRELKWKIKGKKCIAREKEMPCPFSMLVLHRHHSGLRKEKKKLVIEEKEKAKKEKHSARRRNPPLKKGGKRGGPQSMKGEDRVPCPSTPLAGYREQKRVHDRGIVIIPRDGTLRERPFFICEGGKQEMPNEEEKEEKSVSLLWIVMHLNGEEKGLSKRKPLQKKREIIFFGRFRGSVCVEKRKRENLKGEKKGGERE